MRKEEMLASGRELMREFCEENRVAEPGVQEREKREWRFSGTCAYYRAGWVTICPDQCALIGRGGRAWSYPGYVIDRTPHGVVQHELGHHVDWTRSDRRGAYGGDFSVRMRRAAGEERLTGYCPNDWEWWAEMFRLFVTNSDLLREVRPRTYSLIREAGLRPVVDRPWREVLRDAPERTIEMAARKITTSGKSGG